MGTQRKDVLKQLGLDRTGKDPLPEALSPMLASPGGEPFTHPDWLFEVKWDGVRALAFIRGAGRRREVCLQGRNLSPLTSRYPEVVQALSRLPLPSGLILDGEIVALDAQGRPSFQLLQRRIHATKEEEIARLQAEVPVVYYVFDLLYAHGHALLDRPLEERRKVLESLIPPDPVVRISEAVRVEGEAFFQAVRDLGLEGVIAKRLDSRYEPGRRSPSWLKIKHLQRQEAVVGGFTRGRGGRRRTLGALLLGVYNEHGELEYIGHTGSGFTEEELHLLLTHLDGLRTPTCPFARRPRTNERPTWVRPNLVVEVEHAGWTRDGILRFPIYRGIRTDRKPQEVRREPAPAIPVVLTNPRKILWPGPKYTKEDLARYYASVAPFLLPHLRDRPLTLRRFPDGIAGTGFFQKDFPPNLARRGNVDIVQIWSEADEHPLHWILCNSRTALLWLAQLAGIELHPWLSRVTPISSREFGDEGIPHTNFTDPRKFAGSVLNYPDFIAFDIDPPLEGESAAKLLEGFERACQVALKLRDVLHALGLRAFVKTSGKRGLHVLVPISRRTPYAQAFTFARTVSEYLEHLSPGEITTAWKPEERSGKVFLDYHQNGAGKTLVSPYSPRATPHATVSTPLTWEEVEAGVDPLALTLEAIPRRLEEKGDPWTGILATAQDLEGTLGKADAGTPWRRKPLGRGG